MKLYNQGARPPATAASTSAVSFAGLMEKIEILRSTLRWSSRLERADIDQMIALGRVKRGHIGVGKVDEAQNRILPGCFKLDFGGQCDACLLYKMRISS